MSPQFVDFDADGHVDIVTATFEGTAFIVRGSNDGWQPPEHIVDAQGRNIQLNFYYDMEKNNYFTVDRSAEGETHPGDHCISARAVDWDQDGDFDLLLGAKSGNLYLQSNEGTAAEPAFAGVNHMLEAGGAPFKVPSGSTGPIPVDWNGDGLFDLVCGSFQNGVFLYTNSGTASAPKFGAGEALLNEGAITPHGGPQVPNMNCYVEVLDYDADGDLDLVVGGNSVIEGKPIVLTPEQETELARAQDEIAKLEERMEVSYVAYEERMAELEARGEVTDADRQAVAVSFFESDEMKSLQKRHMELYEVINRLTVQPIRSSGVWLYRRK